FARATQLEKGPLVSLRGIQEAELHFALGDISAARTLSVHNIENCEKMGWADQEHRLHSLLGHLALPGDPDEARRRLALARDCVVRTGDMEVLLRSHRLASAIALATNDPSTAIAEAEEGLSHANACGYGLHAIDLLLDLARAHLAADPRASLRRAREA